MLRNRSGCLRTNLAIERQCQRVCRVRKRLSVTAACAWRTDGLRDEPALPAGLPGPVAEVDVLAVEAEAFVEAAELVEHLAAQEEERAEHPVRLASARRAARRAGSGRRWRSCGLSRRRSGVRRTIVPETVGNLLRDGWRVPSELSRSGPGDAAARVLALRSRGVTATAPGFASVSAFATTTNGAVVSAMPRFALAANPRAFSLTIRRASTAGAGGFETTTSSSTCGPSADEAAVELRVRAVRDDDAGDGLTAAPGRRRASAGRSRPS